jgi:2-aminoadipate transaminase
MPLMSRPGLVSFALGLPASELFPTAALARAMAEVLEQDPRALQYEASLIALKTHIVQLMARRGVTCTTDQVFVSAGAQQGMNMLVRVLLDAGRNVLVEDRTYTGLLQVLQPFGARPVPVATDAATGIDPDAVEHALTRGVRPAFIYTMSDGHNPLGVSTPPATRARMVEIARRHRVPIVEDDAYGLLHYGEGEAKPPMRSLDDQWVYYVGSFSKVLAPGLRVGWVVVPPDLTTHLSIVKESTDINTATLAQRAIVRTLDSDLLATHLPRLRAAYRERRDTMVRAIAQHFPSETRVSRPPCGMFVWAELPERLDTTRLFVDAVETERVAFVPGAAFAVEGARPALHCMRLNFSNVAPDRIETGIERLGNAIRRALAG